MSRYHDKMVPGKDQRVWKSLVRFSLLSRSPVNTLSHYCVLRAISGSTRAVLDAGT
jgi:hypothetical protein